MSIPQEQKREKTTSAHKLYVSSRVVHVIKMQSDLSSSCRDLIVLSAETSVR